MKNSLIDSYPRHVAWSEEDGCYVGRCPDLFLGGCHGDNAHKVDAELREIVAEVIADYQREGKPLPPPSPRAARLSEALHARKKARLSQSRFANIIGERVMSPKYGLTGKAIARIIGVLARFPEVEKAVLFGSRAKGTYREGSDIDLALVGSDLDWRKLGQIDEALDDLLLPYGFSLLELSRDTDPEVAAPIRRVGIVFYKKSPAGSEEPLAAWLPGMDSNHD